MLRSFKTLAVILILIAGVTNTHADKIRIVVKQPPPNLMGVSNMWDLTLENTTKSDLKIYVTGTATEDKDGLIIEGKSKVFTIKPGKTNYKYNDFPGAEVKYNNGKYKEVILRTGNAPEGSYTICVNAFEESGEPAGMENCIMQTVQQLGSITLISPEDKAELDPDTLPGLMFSWTPLPKGGPYSLRIVELKGDQSPDVAIKENRPILDVDGIKTTTYHVAPSQVKVIMMGMKYAWQVTSGDVVSDVRIIKGPPINPTNPNEPGISLVTPTNGQEIDPDTLPGLIFSWERNDPCPPHVICNYTLRIVELKGDQSPEEAFRTNPPIIEKDYKSITTQGDPVPGVVVKRGYKYAWQVSSGDAVSKVYVFNCTAKTSQIALLSPVNGTEVDTTNPVIFKWSPAVHKEGEQVKYRLRVWQLMQGQNGTTAMRSNQPIVTKDVDNITEVTISGIYTGPCRPPYLCEFVWNVQAISKEGTGLGENDGYSTESEFRFKENSSGTK